MEFDIDSLSHARKRKEPCLTLLPVLRISMSFFSLTKIQIRT